MPGVPHTCHKDLAGLASPASTDLVPKGSDEGAHGHKHRRSPLMHGVPIGAAQRLMSGTGIVQLALRYLRTALAILRSLVVNSSVSTTAKPDGQRRRSPRPHRGDLHDSWECDLKFEPTRPTRGGCRSRRDCRWGTCPVNVNVDAMRTGPPPKFHGPGGSSLRAGRFCIARALEGSARLRRITAALTVSLSWSA